MSHHSCSPCRVGQIVIVPRQNLASQTLVPPDVVCDYTLHNDPNKLNQKLAVLTHNVVMHAHDREEPLRFVDQELKYKIIIYKNHHCKRATR